MYIYYYWDSKPEDIIMMMMTEEQKSIIQPWNMRAMLFGDGPAIAAHHVACELRNSQCFTQEEEKANFRSFLKNAIKRSKSFLEHNLATTQNPEEDPEDLAYNISFVEKQNEYFELLISHFC